MKLQVHFGASQMQTIILWSNILKIEFLFWIC